MILLADENVDAPIVAALRAAGHRFDYVCELDPGIDDHTVLAFANAGDALLLTSDKDFGELVFRRRLVHAGVVLFRFRLRSDSGSVLNAGSPVYYRGQQVGQVISSRLDDDGTALNIEVFIASPHERLVKANTRFWNVSGLDLTLNAEGIRLDSESFVTILLGGVTFDTPVSIDQESDEAPAGYIFRLYASRDAAHARIYENKQRYLMFFDGSVRGLSIGAPVLLRGIEIGKVLDVQLDFDIEDFTFEIPVLIEVEPERVNIKGDSDGVDYDQSIERLVVAGLRGQLQTGSLLTGQLFVELGFHPEAPAATVAVEDGYKVVPTVPAPLEAVASKAWRITWSAIPRL